MKGYSTSHSPSPHLLIIRFSLMGDVAMSIHAVRALRETYPGLRITIATKPKFAKFYEAVPGVEMAVLENPGNFRCLARLIRKLSDSGINLVADIHNTIRGKIIRNALRFSSGAKVAVLDKQRGLRRKLKKSGCRNIVPLRHNVLRFCDVFSRLGFPVQPPAVNKSVMPMPESFAGMEKTGKWAGFAPFASKEMKIYPENERIRLIELMSGSFEKVFIFGGPGAEKEFAAQMEKKFPNVISVFGRTDFHGEIALMSHLDAVVTMDSSAMHIASLAGVRTVSVWGATHPAAGFYGYGADPGDFVQADLPCRPCSIYGEGHCLRGDFLCMHSISPESIFKKLISNPTMK